MTPEEREGLVEVLRTRTWRDVFWDWFGPIWAGFVLAVFAVGVTEAICWAFGI